jgi:hypothetical protein
MNERVMNLFALIKVAVLFTTAKANDSFTYNQVHNVNLESPSDAYIGNSDCNFSVSSLALMGDKETFGDINIMFHYNEGSETHDDDDNDDDDDQEDDGSCSMLSNESLSRSHYSAFTTTTYVCKEETTQRTTKSHRVKSSPTMAALRLRGGTITSTGASTMVLRKLLVVALVTLVYEGLVGT